MLIKTVADFALALDNGAYAWPGGYPTYFLCQDGAALSFEAALQNKAEIVDALVSYSDNDWKVVAFEINYENPNLYCEHTGKRIESAYAEEDAA